MLDLVVVQEHALIELRRLRAIVLCILGATPVLPGHADLVRGRHREASLPSRAEVAPERDLPVPRAVRRRSERPLGGFDPATDEDDLLRFQVEPADVPSELMPTSVVEKDILCEIAAGMEDLAVRVVLEDEDRALFIRELEANMREGSKGSRARFSAT